MKHHFFVFFIFTFGYLQSQNISGDWYGKLNISGQSLPLIFHVERENSTYYSTLDSPRQNTYNLKADSTFFSFPEVLIKLNKQGITFRGIYNEERETIKGTFEQGDLNLSLSLSKEIDSTDSNELRSHRPQEPKPPFPYHIENVSFTNPVDSLTLSGTLTVPAKEKNFPAVVLVSGSGPQNRNSEIYDHKPFLVLADFLSRRGIAVLRFDDRGVNESEGDFSQATTKDFVRDVEAAIKFLHSRKEIDPKKIGVIGHSEGGLIAAMIAAESRDTDFIVLLAGQGLRGDANLLLQKKLLEQKSGLKESDINKSQEIFKKAYALISRYEGQPLIERLNEHFQKYFGDKLQQEQINLLSKGLTTPWMQFYLSYDPSVAFRKIKIPVLALYGQNDLQISPNPNATIVDKSLKEGNNENSKIVIFDNLNHLFQESNTGLPEEYSKIEQTISPVVLQTISSWISEQ